MSTDYADQVLLEAETMQDGPQMPPTLPVCVIEKVITEEVTSQEIILDTIQIPANSYVELAGDDPFRTRIQITAVAGKTQVTPAAPAVAYGTAAAPAANANVSGTIVAASLPAGLYQIDVSVFADGTVAAATDDDNMKLSVSGGGPVIRIPYEAGGQAVTRTFFIYLNGTQTLSVLANANATAGTVYHAEVTATPYPPAVATSPGVAICHSKGNAVKIAATGTLTGPPAGLAGGTAFTGTLDLHTTARLWIVDLTGAPNSVSIAVERRAP